MGQFGVAKIPPEEEGFIGDSIPEKRQDGKGERGLSARRAFDGGLGLGSNRVKEKRKTAPKIGAVFPLFDIRME